jgi:hypothetical protein
MILSSSIHTFRPRLSLSHNLVHNKYGSSTLSEHAGTTKAATNLTNSCTHLHPFPLIYIIYHFHILDVFPISPKITPTLSPFTAAPCVLHHQMSADIPVEEAKTQLLAIQKSVPANQKCADCSAPSPTWASPFFGSISLIN